jgi:phosphomannomutase
MALCVNPEKRSAGGDIIHLGPSGNAIELRCYTESDTAERAAAIMRRPWESCGTR